GRGAILARRGPTGRRDPVPRFFGTAEGFLMNHSKLNDVWIASEREFLRRLNQFVWMGSGGGKVVRNGDAGHRAAVNESVVTDLASDHQPSARSDAFQTGPVLLPKAAGELRVDLLRVAWMKDLDLDQVRVSVAWPLVLPANDAPQ